MRYLGAMIRMTPKHRFRSPPKSLWSSIIVGSHVRLRLHELYTSIQLKLTCCSVLAPSASACGAPLYYRRWDTSRSSMYMFRMWDSIFSMLLSGVSNPWRVQNKRLFASGRYVPGHNAAKFRLLSGFLNNVFRMPFHLLYWPRMLSTSWHLLLLFRLWL